MKTTAFLGILLFFLLSEISLFAENVTGWREFDTQYCKLYLYEGANPYRIDREIKVHTIKLYANPRVYRPTDKVLDSLTSKIDLIFIKVCEILDMKPDTNRVSIKIVRTKEELSDEYEKLFKEARSLKAFYVNKLNTIFTSEQTISEGILAHELTHAVIDNYFVMVPPPKIQEILSTYVDKELKR